MTDPIHKQSLALVLVALTFIELANKYLAVREFCMFMAELYQVSCTI